MGQYPFYDVNLITQKIPQMGPEICLHRIMCDSGLRNIGKRTADSFALSDYNQLVDLAPAGQLRRAAYGDRIVFVFT